MGFPLANRRRWQMLFFLETSICCDRVTPSARHRASPSPPPFTLSSYALVNQPADRAGNERDT